MTRDIRRPDPRPAAADPLHREEPDLLAELTAHDGRRLQDLALAVAGVPPPPGCRAVRVDRFGLVFAVPDPGGRTGGLSRPVTDRRQLAWLIP